MPRLPALDSRAPHELFRELRQIYRGALLNPPIEPLSDHQGLLSTKQDSSLQFGRLDFLQGQDGYHFLEVNSNGEWAWLDTEGRYGLLPKVAEEIDPATARHSIPMIGAAASRA